MTATPVLNSCATVLPVPQAAPVGAPAQKEGLFLSILGKAVQENLPGQVQDPALSPLQAKDPLARPEEDDTAAPLSEEEGKHLSPSDIPLSCMAAPDPAIQWAKADSPKEADRGIAIRAGQRATQPMGAKQTTLTPMPESQVQAEDVKAPEDPAGLQRGEKPPAEKAPVQPAFFRTGGKEQFSPAGGKTAGDAQRLAANPAEPVKTEKASPPPADGQEASQGLPPFLAALQARAGAKEKGRAAYELKTPASGKNPLQPQNAAAKGETSGAPKAYDPLGGFSLEKLTADGQKGETGGTSLTAGAKSPVSLRKTLPDGGENFSQIKKTEKTGRAEGTDQTPYAQLFKGTGEIKFQPAASDSPQGAKQAAYAQVLDKITGHLQENGTQKIRMKLYPEGLGELHITLTCKEDTVSVHILAETAATAKLLESQAGELRGALLTKNYEVSSLSFDTRSDWSGQAHGGFSFFEGNAQGKPQWRHEAYPLFDGAEALQNGEEIPLPLWTNISAGRINFWA